MELFLATMGRMAYLFSFIAIGTVLARFHALPEGSAKVISKLESNLFLPAMVLNTFLSRFTVETLVTARNALFFSTAVMLCAIALSLLCVRFLSRDAYIRRIYTYGLSFGNFGFMGYAVVQSLFPQIYFEYVIFTLPLWTGIYMWGLPELLIADTGKKGVKDRLKNFANPMFVCMILGMVLGLSGVGSHFPQWSMDVIRAAEGCMSPLAMLITGVTLATVDLKKTFTDLGIYGVTAFRLVVFPGLFLLIGKLLGFSGSTSFLCALCTLAMPLGLNTIVVPAAYGKDTSKAAGMALISHALSCVTIPILFSFV